jgi:hypothetical protein
VVVLMGILYGLVPEGRWRKTGKRAAAGLVTLVAVAHLHLGIEAPTEVLVGVAVGVAGWPSWPMVSVVRWATRPIRR